MKQLESEIFYNLSFGPHKNKGQSGCWIKERVVNVSYHLLHCAAVDILMTPKMKARSRRLVFIF